MDVDSRPTRRTNLRTGLALLLYWASGGAVSYWLVSRAPASDAPVLIGLAIAMAVGMPLVVLAGLRFRWSAKANLAGVASLAAGFVMLVFSQVLDDGSDVESVVVAILGIALALFGAVILDRPNEMP